VIAGMVRCCYTVISQALALLLLLRSSLLTLCSYCRAVLLAAGIACPHGRLAPEGRSGAAKRFAVSEHTWSLLKRLWPQQVLLDVQARRDKAKRAAAKCAAAGGVDVAAVADAAKGECC
jgi:hypothetical protein